MKSRTASVGSQSFKDVLVENLVSPVQIALVSKMVKKWSLIGIPYMNRFIWQSSKSLNPKKKKKKE